MPLSGIKAPSEAKCVAVVEWRRYPAQPVTFLIGSANPPLALISHNPLKAVQKSLCAVEFEKDLLIERTHSGLARARAAGKRFGRPPALNPDQRQVALEHLKAGASISAVASQFGTSRQTIMRLRDDAGTTVLPE